MRIVSLLPSATEMVSALGLSDLLVGVSHRCEWPPGVQQLPRVTRSPLTTERTAAAISATIERNRSAKRPIFQVDEELLRSLAPDVILTQDVCEVCAVPAEQARSAASVVMGAPRVISLQARRLADILMNLESLGLELGVPERGHRLVGQIRRRLATISQAVGSRLRPRVFAVEWLEPLKCTGAWLPDLIAAAGGESLLAVPGEKVRPVDWEEVRKVRPEVLLIMPCGWPLSRVVEQARQLSERPGWRELPAVQTGRVYLLDGRLCSMHGPRVADAVELLARLLHPHALPGSSDPALALSWEQAYGERP